MATRALITVDTELSLAKHQRGVSPSDNFAISISGQCVDGEFGIGYQMDRMAAHGLKGVFFVDPMPALVYGPAIIADIVRPILERGHEVQLHLHAEWLHFADHPLAISKPCCNIGDFSYEAQLEILGLARELLVAAGAPAPCAFRAGNFGANDDTLRALASLGFTYDSSFSPSFADGPCGISLSPDLSGMTEHMGVLELPVGAIDDGVKGVRHAQFCALSAREMRRGLDHAADIGARHFVIVGHSFEMLSRDRKRANRMTIKRFERLCRHIELSPNLTTAGFDDLTPKPAPDLPRLATGLAPTLERYAEQAVATLLYERGEVSAN